MLRRLLPLGALLALPAAALAQSSVLPRTHAPEPTHPAITAGDLMTRLYIFADDSMMGRQAGTIYNLKGTAYIADQVRKLGLVPAGDSGGYFQNVPLVRSEVASTSALSVDGVPLALWTDVAPVGVRGALRPIDGAQVVYGGVFGDSAHALDRDQVAGKLVVFSLPEQDARGLRGLTRTRIAPDSPLAAASGVALIGLQMLPPNFIGFLRRPSTRLVDASESDAPSPVVLLITPSAAQTLLGAAPDSLQPGAAGRTVHGAIVVTSEPAPARNVVAILPGRDPKLKGEYVAIGAHNDHIGFSHTPVDHDSLRAYNMELARLRAANGSTPLTREQIASIHVNVDSLRRIRPARLDSINNGADDDGSGTVTALEIAEAFAKQNPRPRRSILFVWHTGEELGLYGSEWYTDHPTVPRDSIVAQLNMDMVGRGSAQDIPGGGPTYLELVGSRRLSTELGDLVEAVNKTEKRPFIFDYQFDANGQPERIYCRSDHYEYARYGIPITFFTTGLHEDYHKVTDEPQYIDYDHMARVGQLVHDVALKVADLDHRVVVDKPKPDPKAACVQ